ncbi:hypothetical protein Q7A53_05900 [Halobacillus rhizosphaerae]|uniref:hypothetical protein n=1 Tax=Halobacillus rhizosphaerae TaxID=3064889 RepID=UPI00398B6D2B
MELIKTLDNGVSMYHNNIKQDFRKAQEILNMFDETKIIDAQMIYNNRINNEYEYSYQYDYSRMNNYYNLIDMINECKQHLKRELFEESKHSYALYQVKDISSEERQEQIRDIERRRKEGCKCAVCAFNSPSLEEWESGYMKYKGKRVTIEKALKKAGFKKELINHYMKQEKERKEMFLTISSSPQFIVGCNYNLIEDIKRSEYLLDNKECSLELAGCLHDDRLYIAMLHESLEDLDNMDGALYGYAMMRHITLNGNDYMIAVSYHGSNTTVSMLDDCIKQLESINVMSNEHVKGNDMVRLNSNGSYEIVVHDDIVIHESIDSIVSYECILCNGVGVYDGYSNRMNDSISVVCPMCDGNKKITENVHKVIDETIRVNKKIKVLPYCKGYNHYGDYIELAVSGLL